MKNSVKRLYEFVFIVDFGGLLALLMYGLGNSAQAQAIMRFMLDYGLFAICLLTGLAVIVGFIRARISEVLYDDHIVFSYVWRRWGWIMILAGVFGLVLVIIWLNSHGYIHRFS